MRSPLGKAVRKRFDQQLRMRLPAFQPDLEAIVPPGYRVYRWQSHELACFIVLCPYSNRDAFTVECAWSYNGGLPMFGGIQHPRSWPDRGIKKSDPINGQMYFRLGQLWQPGDYWWWLVPESHAKEQIQKVVRAVTPEDFLGTLEDPPLEEAMANVTPMVDDAVQKVVNYAIPYFENVIKSSENVH